MELDFYWKHMQSSPATEEYASKKFSKLDKYLHKIISSNMSTELVNGKKKVKLTISADGESFVAESENDDINTCIDQVEEKMGTQLRRYHAKNVRHKS